MRHNFLPSYNNKRTTPLNMQPLLSPTYNQRGSSLVIAIFILVVMSLLGAALIKILLTDEQAFTYEVLGTRAYNAAQSGIQWRAQQVFPLGEVGSAPDKCINDTLNLKNIEGFYGCEAIVECNVLYHDTTTFFTITSLGQCEINGELTSRKVEIQAKSIN